MGILCGVGKRRIRAVEGLVDHIYERQGKGMILKLVAGNY